MMELIPTLVFNGKCEEALNFYKNCFGGDITYLERYQDAPVDYNPVFGDKILHSKFEFGGNTLFASDTIEGRQIKIGGNISLTVEYDSKEELEDVYDKLSENATIISPLQDSFWGTSFAILTDKFEVTWNLNFTKLIP